MFRSGIGLFGPGEYRGDAMKHLNFLHGVLRHSDETLTKK